MNLKHFYILISIMIMLIGTSCEAKDSEADNLNDDIITEEQIPKDTATEDVVIEEEPIKDIISSEVINKVLYTFNDDMVALYVCAEIKNTGNVPIEIDNVSFDIEDENGSFVTNINRYDGYVNPSVILPGESSYIADFTFDWDRKLTEEKCKNVIPNYIIEKTERKIISHEVEDVTVHTDSDYWTASGRVINNTNEIAKRVKVSIALYDKERNLIGVIVPFFNDPINPNSKLGFDNDNVPIPSLELNKEDIVEIVPIATSLSY